MAILNKMILFVILAIAICVDQTQAHMVWVYSEEGKVKVVLAESTSPDKAQFLPSAEKMKAFTFVDGEPKEVKFEKVEDGDDGWYEIAQSEVGSAVSLNCTYGVFNRGDTSMLLDYTAKYIQMPSDAASTKSSPELKLDILPTFENGQLKVAVHFKGMPLNNAEVSLLRIESDSFQTKTGDTGSVVLAAPTRYIVRAKHVVDEAGEIEGKKFSDQRFYCTMVIDLGGEASEATTAASMQKPSVSSATKSSMALKKIDRGYEEFPRGMTSFGATVLNGKVYVTGGKSGRAHHYARSYQNREIWCLDLAGKKWKTVGDTLGLQGLAIVGYDNQIIRIGGLEARNEEGEEHALCSLDAVKAFNPETKAWTSLPSLPHGRSSLDACLYENKVYVAGGWTMAIDEESEWASDMLVLDLAAEEPKWESIPTPFQVRAVAVREFDNKLFVLGGINEDGPTDEVHIFDLKTQQWTEGPAIPAEGGMLAFGCSATTVDGHLLVSTYDGAIFGLNDDHSDWEKVHQLEEGRFFHQMLPVDESSFAMIGGAHMRHGSQNEIAVFSIAKTNAETDAAEETETSDKTAARVTTNP